MEKKLENFAEEIFWDDHDLLAFLFIYICKFGKTQQIKFYQKFPQTSLGMHIISLV